MRCIEEDVDPQDIQQDDGHDGIDEDGRHHSGAGNIRVSLYLTIADTHIDLDYYTQADGAILAFYLENPWFRLES